MKNLTSVDKQEAKKDERFLRQGFLDSFIEFVKSTSSKNQSYVVAVDGVYGSGKSFFLERFEESIKNEYPTLLMNAWEDEIHQNPLFSILLNLFIFVNENNIPGISKEGLSRAVTSALGNIGNDVSKRFLGIDFKKVYSEANNEFNSKEDKIIYELLLGIIKEKKCVDYFKDALVDFHQNHEKLIIIVDELDRCSPTYAIRFLETLHHFFKIPNVTFVLGINKKQIEISVKKIYGHETNTEEYLRKFIDRFFSLGAIGEKELQDYIIGEIQDIKPSISQDIKLNTYIQLMSSLIAHTKLVFRQINHLVNDYLDFIRRDDRMDYSHPDEYQAAAYYLLIRMLDKDLGAAIRNNNFNPVDVIKLFYDQGLFHEVVKKSEHYGKEFNLLDLILQQPYPENNKDEILNSVQQWGLSVDLMKQLENAINKETWNNKKKPEIVLAANSIENAQSLTSLSRKQQR